MQRAAWKPGFGLTVLGLGLAGCYAHHTADEAIDTSNADSGDGGTVEVDPCADVADDDVAKQMACDPDLHDAGTTGTQTGTSSQASGATAGSAACTNATDVISQLVCTFGNSTTTGGTGGGTTAQTGQTATSAVDLIGLLGGFGGSTSTTQTNGIDVNTLISLLNGTQTGTGTGGFIGGQTNTGGFIGGLTGGAATNGGFIGGATNNTGTGGFIGGQTTGAGALFGGGQTTGAGSLFGGTGGTGVFGGGGLRQN